MIKRYITRPVRIRGLTIGGGADISIQSMTNVKTTDVEAVLSQIDRLTSAGCDIVRITVPNSAAAAAFSRIRSRTDIPLVADIHFDYRLAIAAIEAGADKIRINPGNIGSEERVRTIVDAAKTARIPIRIGVNSGSLRKDLLDKYGGPTAEALFESAINHIRLIESMGFYDIVVSIKASSVTATMEACRLLARNTDIPQHIGITESGTVRSGTIRSAVGIGALLAEGIGDTIRVSLAGDPVNEVFVAKEILKSLDLAKGPVVIACPTCGRTEIDVAKIASEVEETVKNIRKPIVIAIMGCVVNGPGEAREADIGIAGGKHEGLIFVRGKPLKKVPEKLLLEEFKKEISKMSEESE